MHQVSMIVAHGTTTRAIGKDGHDLWNIKADRRRFRKITEGHPVIMGHKTWTGIPEQFRPLPQRANIVISHDSGLQLLGALVVGHIEAALRVAEYATGGHHIYIIGGGTIYHQALDNAEDYRINTLYVTEVDSDEEGDTFFPPYQHLFKEVDTAEEHVEEGLTFRFRTYTRV